MNKLLIIALLSTGLLCYTEAAVHRLSQQDILRFSEKLSQTLVHKNEEQDSCSCENNSLCQSLGLTLEKNNSLPHVQEYLAKQNKSEVFAFVLPCNVTTWSKFSWIKLTTIVLVNFYDEQLVCHAHQHGVQVVNIANIPKTSLSNTTARLTWVLDQLQDVQSKGLDGINIDFEDSILPDTPEQQGYTDLVKEATTFFHSHLPHSQVSVDVAWSSAGVDQRYYEYAEIAEACDFIFVMGYDEQSQIWDSPCSARPNSGIYKTVAGLESYFKLGVPPHKIVLGVPWYGYNYPCLSLDQNGTCFIEKIPFRGCNCSDAAGTEHPFNELDSLRAQYGAKYLWDKYSNTPYYSYKNKTTGQYHQVRYDDARSLPYKYMVPVFYKLRGVGMWTANFLNYEDTPDGQAQRDTMWGLLP